MRPSARDGWLVLAIWLALSLLGELLLSVAIGRYPVAASLEGEISDEAIFYLLRWTIPIAVAVVLVLIYAPLRFAARPRDGEGDAPFQPRNNMAIGLTWLLVSSALAVSFVLTPGVTGLRAIWASESAENPLEVEVVSRQWEWAFNYPELGIEEAGELVLPIDRTVRFTITSEDVIHSFWIPSLRIKKDAVPGEPRTLFLTPSEITSTEEDPMTRVQCAELCGVGHARMRAPARVVTAADFQMWVEEQGGTAVMNMGSATPIGGE